MYILEVNPGFSFFTNSEFTKMFNLRTGVFKPRSPSSHPHEFDPPLQFPLAALCFLCYQQKQRALAWVVKVLLW